MRLDHDQKPDQRSKTGFFLFGTMALIDWKLNKQLTKRPCSWHQVWSYCTRCGKTLGTEIQVQTMGTSSQSLRKSTQQQQAATTKFPKTDWPWEVKLSHLLSHHLWRWENNYWYMWVLLTFLQSQPLELSNKDLLEEHCMTPTTKNIATFDLRI